MSFISSVSPREQFACFKCVKTSNPNVISAKGWVWESGKHIESPRNEAQRKGMRTALFIDTISIQLTIPGSISKVAILHRISEEIGWDQRAYRRVRS